MEGDDLNKGDALAFYSPLTKEKKKRDLFARQ